MHFLMVLYRAKQILIEALGNNQPQNMVFEINGKVALITGGASGIGFMYAKQLLRNGLRGVTLADICPEKGQQALDEINAAYGPDKAIFVETDVTNYEQFKEAFKQTINTFKNVDILINNAGILDDKQWEKQIAINVNGVIHGMLLGLDNYIPKYKTGEEGVIVNISSVAGIEKLAVIPIYAGTKHAVYGMTRSWGDLNHYERTKVKVLGMCPGVTNTPLISEAPGKNLGPIYEALLVKEVGTLPKQDPICVARAMVKIIMHAKSGTIWVAEGGEDPYEFIIPDRATFKANQLQI